MKKEIVFFFAALILFSLVVFDMYPWIEIDTDSSKPFEQAKREYLERFPVFFRNAHLTTTIEVLLMFIAGVLFISLSL